MSRKPNPNPWSNPGARWKSALYNVFGIGRVTPSTDIEMTADEFITRSSELVFNVAKIVNGFVVLIETYDKHGDGHRTAHYCKDISDLPEVIASLSAQYKLKL